MNNFFWIRVYLEINKKMIGYIMKPFEKFFEKYEKFNKN